MTTPFPGASLLERSQPWTSKYTTRIHREGELYVAHVQEIDVSSAGTTIDEARAHLREAVALFLEEAERMGTLGEILEEAGYAVPR